MNLPWKDVHCTSHMIYFNCFKCIKCGWICLSETLGLLYLLNVKLQHWLLASSYSWGDFPAAGREVWWGFLWLRVSSALEFPQCAENVHLSLEEALCDQQMEDSKTIMLHLQSPDTTYGIQNDLCCSWKLLRLVKEKSFVRNLWQALALNLQRNTTVCTAQLCFKDFHGHFL